MVVGFTGTRSGPTPAQHEAMRYFLGGIPMTRFIHGGAPHCDTFAHNIARARGVPIEIYPADAGSSTIVWMPPEGTIVHDPAPPLGRDRVIVSLIHGLLAVPRTDTEGDSGTWATVRYAREIGCPVYVIRQDGRIVRYC